MERLDAPGVNGWVIPMERRIGLPGEWGWRKQVEALATEPDRWGLDVRQLTIQTSVQPLHRLGVHLFFVQFTTVGRPRTGAGLLALDCISN